MAKMEISSTLAIKKEELEFKMKWIEDQTNLKGKKDELVDNSLKQAEEKVESKFSTIR